MAFRFLVYRTDFGNTIVRESPTSSSTGGTEAELFTDFIIPEIQPLYLWRVTGGTTVVPNTDQNIEDWLNATNPPDGEDPVTLAVFSAYTAQTQTQLDDKVSFTIFNAYTAQTATDLDGKIDKVTGATGNVPTFTVDGGLEDSGFTIAQLTGGSGQDIFVSGGTLNGSAQLVLNRSEGQSDVVIDLSALSGGTDGVVSGATLSGQTLVLSRTEGLPDVTADLSGLIGDVESDIIALSGQVVQNTTNIATVSGQTDQNTADIITLSATTAGKQDALSAGEGINAAALTNDIIQVDLSSFTAIGGLDITLTGSTNAVITDLRTIAAGIQYASDYSANYTNRSLVDKSYVDNVAAGLDPKQAVIVGTALSDGNIDLTGGTFGGTLDGITLQDGWRILVKNQTNAVENGIYDYSSGSNTFTRSSDFDGNPAGEVTSGAFTTVVTGNTQAASSWIVVTPDPITVGTTEINWTLLSKPIEYNGGVGIIVSGTTIIFDGLSVAGDFLEWDGTQLNVTGVTSLSDFTTYTGLTDTRLTNIETDLTTVSGQTDQNTSDIAALSGSSISIDQFTGYTATTDTRITNIEGDVITISGDVVQNTSDIATLSATTENKLDTSIFTGYTANTQSNEIFLVHTGGTNVNTIIATAIVWNSGVTVGSAYSFTGSTIEILETGEYEITYNIPFNQEGNNSDRGIGGNIILNNNTVIDVTAAAGYTSRSNLAGSVGLPTVNLSLTAGDQLDLALFRTGQNGVVTTSRDGTILIKKKNTLQ